MTGISEEYFRKEVQLLFREIGFWDYHPPDDSPAATDKQIEQIMKLFPIKPEQWDPIFKEIRNILRPPAWKRGEISLSRPDIINYNPLDVTVVVECKMIEPKKEIEPYLNPAQIRDGQRNWLDAWKYQASGFTYLGLGTREGSPRRGWLWPWDQYAELEKRLIREDLNFKVPMSMFPDEYELIWIPERERVHKSVVWALPEFHPLVTKINPATSPFQVDWKKTYSLRLNKDK